jgi:broad specificity phosphatase PhoE
MITDPRTTRRVYIVRHGQRRDVTDPAWARHAARPWDPPLAYAGREEALRLAAALARSGIDAIFSSPFLRTLETAAPLALAADLPIFVEPGLSEWLTPDWFPVSQPTLSLQELKKRFPRIDPDYVPVGRAVFGESGDAALERSAVTAIGLVHGHDGNLALFGHGASILGAAAGLLKADPDRLKQREAWKDPPPSFTAELIRVRGAWEPGLVQDFCTSSQRPGH